MVTHQAAMEAALIIIVSVVISIVCAFVIGYTNDILSYRIDAMCLTKDANPSSGWLDPGIMGNRQFTMNLMYAIIYAIPILGVAAAFKRAVLEDERRDWEYDEGPY